MARYVMENHFLRRRVKFDASNAIQIFFFRNSFFIPYFPLTQLPPSNLPCIYPYRPLSFSLFFHEIYIFSAFPCDKANFVISASARKHSKQGEGSLRGYTTSHWRVRVAGCGWVGGREKQKDEDKRRKIKQERLRGVNEKVENRKKLSVIIFFFNITERRR